MAPATTKFLLYCADSASCELGMTDGPITREDIRKAIAEDLRLSGVDLEYIVSFTEDNVCAFREAITRFASCGAWEEIEVGGEKLQALGNTTGWDALRETGLALSEAARQKDSAALKAAQLRLRGLERILSGSLGSPGETATVHS